MKNERTKGVFTENVCMLCIVVLVTELYCCCMGVTASLLSGEDAHSV